MLKSVTALFTSFNTLIHLYTDHFKARPTPRGVQVLLKPSELGKTHVTKFLQNRRSRGRWVSAGRQVQVLFVHPGSKIKGGLVVLVGLHCPEVHSRVQSAWLGHQRVSFSFGPHLRLAEESTLGLESGLLAQGLPSRASHPQVTQAGLRNDSSQRRQKGSAPHLLLTGPTRNQRWERRFPGSTKESQVLRRRPQVRPVPAAPHGHRHKKLPGWGFF